MLAQTSTPTTSNLSLYQPPRCWADLAAIEPRLRDIEARAVSLSRRRGNRRGAYETIRFQVSRYVGWNAKDSRIATAKCYELAIEHLLGIIDGARNRGR